MKTLLIVGAGGIGSHLAHHLHNLSEHHQLDNVEITFADDDTVDLKNLPYQLFTKYDILDNKAECLFNKYKFNYIPKRIENSTQLNGFDCIVGAVDNTKFRKLLFTYSKDNPKVHWIDLRSEGRQFIFYTKNKVNTYDKMLTTLKEMDDDDSGSCQLEYELENNIIQLGNRIVASIGAQLILNWHRGEYSSPFMSMRI